jgi:hypothetical protein
MLMVINMKGIGKTGRDQGREYINTQMEMFTKVNGLMT